MNTLSLAVLLAWPCEFRFVEAEFSLLALAAKRNDASSYSLVERALIVQGKSARVFLYVRDTIEAAPDKVQAHMIESLAERFPIRNRFEIHKCERTRQRFLSPSWWRPHFGYCCALATMGSIRDPRRSN